MKAGKNGLGLAVAFAPVIFICHILEESTGYVTWFNEQVRNGITMPLFWRVNTLSLAITLLVMSMELVKPSIFSAFLIVLWFGVLMLANCIRSGSVYASRIKVLNPGFKLCRVCCRSGQCHDSHLQKQALVERRGRGRCHWHCIGTTGVFRGKQNWEEKQNQSQRNRSECRREEIAGRARVILWRLPLSPSKQAKPGVARRNVTLPSAQDISPKMVIAETLFVQSSR